MSTTFRLVSNPLWLATFSLCLGVPASLVGQTVMGSISGLVTDTTGAAIVDVPVTVKDLDRNTTLRVTTNVSGFYLASPLPNGRYQLTAEKTGFRRFLLEEISLSTQQKAVVNITLALGGVAEAVTVSAQTQLIEPGSAALSSVTESKQILDLPLNGRNAYNLVLLTPGVFSHNPTPSTPSNYWVTQEFSVNGGLEDTNSVFLDGASVDVPFQTPNYNSGSIIPPLDGVQEFRIQTNSYSAEYGRSAGGFITIATKSGTNEPHGTLFEFVRNSYFNANNFFSNLNGVPPASGKSNTFGASFGGPVIVPKYNGKNRMFFFVTYEGQRNRNGATFNLTVPTLLQRQGDFSQTLNSAGQMIAVYNPLTTQQISPGVYTRQPFPGNRIPASMLDPIAVKLVQYYPQPNNPGVGLGVVNNFAAQVDAPSGLDSGTLKVDRYIGANQRFSARYSARNAPTSNADPYAGTSLGARSLGCPSASGCEDTYDREQNFALDYTNTLNSSAVVDVRYGFGRGILYRRNWSTGFNDASLGFPAQVFSAGAPPTFPYIAVTNLASLGASEAVYRGAGMTHSVVGNVTKVIGAHALKFGSELRFNFENFIQQGAEPSLSFTPSYTQGPNPLVASANAGLGLASLLLGFGGGGYAVVPSPAASNRYAGVYAQDDYRVNRKLTLNLGLRWDLETGVTERYNRYAVFNPYVPNPASQAVGMNLMGGWVFPGSSSIGRNEVPLDKKVVSPRIGLAYELNSKTVIRAGYGMFYGPPPWEASGIGGAPYSPSTPWVSTIDAVTPVTLLSQAFQGPFVQATGSSQGLLTALGQGVASPIPALMKAWYAQQWNLTLQRQIGQRMVVEIAYAGNKGTHLPGYDVAPGNWQLDQLNPSYLSKGNALLALVPNPFYGTGLVTAGALTAPTVLYEQLLRPYPQYSGVTGQYVGAGDSNFNALEARFERRYSGGASVVVSYTFSKTIADYMDGTWFRSYSIRNYYCLSCEKARSSQDQTHHFVASFTYELPFGRGRLLGAGWNRGIDGILGQWQVNGILTLTSGEPLPFVTTSNTSFSEGGNQHPDFTGVNPDLGSKQSIYRWFDTSRFKLPAQFTFGNLGRTTNLTSDPGRQLDFSIFKNFRIRERLEAQLRGEAFNIVNHPIFAAPDTSLGDSTFGLVTAQQNGARSLQLALKLLF